MQYIWKNITWLIQSSPDIVYVRYSTGQGLYYYIQTFKELPLTEKAGIRFNWLELHSIFCSLIIIDLAAAINSFCVQTKCIVQTEVYHFQFYFIIWKYLWVMGQEKYNWVFLINIFTSLHSLYLNVFDKFLNIHLIALQIETSANWT